MRLAIERSTLDNGLSVVLDRDASAPTVTVGVLYRCGARDEPAGQSGIAQLLAAMSFEGGKHLRPGQHSQLVARRGGHSSASVDHDRTLFLDELPGNELSLGLWLEAQRMRWATLPASRLPAVRRAAEAHAQRALAAPLAHAELRLGELAFQGLLPYSQPALGVPDEIAHTGARQIKALYGRCYRPENAVLVVAGSFDPERAMGLVHHHFDPIVRHKRAPNRLPLSAPHQTSERFSVLGSARAESAALFNAWVIPPPHSAGHDALELLARVLGDGESSRLYDSLVRVHGLARDVSAWTEGRHGPDLLGIRVLLAAGANPDRVQKLVDAELARLSRHAPGAAELEKARARERTEFLLGLQSNRQRAARLAEAEAFDGDARSIANELAGFESVTASGVAGAAAKYLTARHRTVVELQEPPPPEAKHHHTAKHHAKKAGR